MMRRARSQSGFTLPEVMVTMAILGLIVTSMAFALIAALKNDEETTQRLRESHDAELVSTYLPSDLQSTSSNIVAAPVPNTDCSGVSNLLRLRWTEQLTTGGATTTYTAAYAILNQSGEWRLVRHYCVGGGSADQLVVARNLLPSCAAPNCVITQTGRRVDMKLTAKSGYTYTITGFRRTP